MRQAFAPAAFGIFLLCLCILSLLAGVLYFYLEAIGFMLTTIAKSTHSERLKILKRANRICAKEITRLKKLYPNIDVDNLIREELRQAEVRNLRSAYPELDWKNIICDSQICWLQKCYPFINWSSILLQELPDVIRAQYPYINWDHIIEEYKCERELEELKSIFPTIICEAKIRELRNNVPYLNWDGIVAEVRIQKLRETFPDIDFDRIVQKSIQEAEISKLRSAYPGINWERVINEERINWLRARYPRVNWENLTSEVSFSKLKELYPQIDWTSTIRSFVCEKETEEIKDRFNCLDWESIVKGGGDPDSIRLTKSEAITRLNSRFPNVPWEEIITQDISDSAINLFQEIHPYLDWDVIITAMFEHLSRCSLNFKSSEICQKFEEFIPHLEEAYPHVKWDHFVEQRHLSPLINWEYVFQERGLNLYPSGTPLRSTVLEKLLEKYHLINWSSFEGMECEKVFHEHPYIKWSAILEPDDVYGDESGLSVSEIPDTSKTKTTEDQTETTTVEDAQLSDRLNGKEPKNKEEYLLEEYKMRRSLQLGDFSLRLNEDENILEGISPRTSMLISNEIRALSGSNFVSIVDHELSSRKRNVD